MEEEHKSNSSVLVNNNLWTVTARYISICMFKTFCLKTLTYIHPLTMFYTSKYDKMNKFSQCY